MKKSGKRTLLIVVLLLAIVAVTAAAWIGLHLVRHEKRQNSDLEALQNQVGSLLSGEPDGKSEIVSAREEFLREIDSIFISGGSLNAYQKLACGEDIRFLVVGDSIGAMEWTNDVAAWVEENYLVHCTIKNISLGGNTSYSGYVSEKLLDDGIAYDLVLVCYGQNDAPKGFAADYEALIREVLTKNNMPCVISVLESSQREYTEKMQDIGRIAEHYNLKLADTIEAFETSGYSYEALSADGVHPNGIGQGIYAETVKEVIRSSVAEVFAEKGRLILEAMQKGRAYSPEDYGVRSVLPEPMDQEGVAPFECFRYVPSADFQRISDTEWVIHFDHPLVGILGINRSRCPGENLFEIYRNDELYYSEEDYLSIGYYLMKISKVSETAETFTGDLRVKFLQKDHADNFFGILFTDYEEAD